MHAPLVLLLMIAFAFLAALIEARVLGPSRRPLGAAVYLIIGFVFGPSALAVLNAEALEALSGMEAVVSAFVGMSVGLPLGRKGPRLARSDSIGFGVMFMAVTTLIVGGVSYLVLGWWPALGLADDPALLVAALTLGLSAAISSPDVMRAAVETHLADGPVSRLMPTALTTSRFLAIFAFGLVVAFAPGAPLVSAAEAALAVAAGLGVGIAFHAVVGAQVDPHRLMVATVGSLALGAGLAESLALSPLMVGLTSGVTVGMLSPTAESITGTIGRLERPAVVALFIFGGAHFSLRDSLFLIVPVGYVFVRVIALRIAAFGARPISKDVDRSVRGLWRGFLHQGALSAAIALDFDALVDGPIGLLVENTLLLAAIVNAIVSWNAARDLLRDVGETGRRRPDDPAPAIPRPTPTPAEAH